ncbi:MAG: Gfo/Idh/MocA family oxidoreductase [Phycisphaerae bacterium]|nr:Gfo/Idh/MocA family oxidoreductase [Phycisphaerae bacterium]
MRIGIVGLDSSHAVEFGRRVQILNAAGVTRCRVSCCWNPASPAGDRATRLPPALENLGIEPAASLEELLGAVSGLMILSADGHQHLAPAVRALRLGIPTFIDKPLTCSAIEARALLDTASGSRCFSASALRFADGLNTITASALGDFRTIEASGPFQETPAAPGLWYYGCHTFEFVDSLWPQRGGIEQVRARLLETGHHIELKYRDGRSAVIGLDRTGDSPWRARIIGARGDAAFVANLGPAYDRLVAEICSFFEGKPPIVSLHRTVEIIQTIDACHQSIAMGGAWMPVPEVCRPPECGTCDCPTAGSPHMATAAGEKI